MKQLVKTMYKWAFVGLLSCFGFAVATATPAMAEGYGLTVAPMSQNIILIPGESLSASFRISNPSSSTQDTYYKIEIEPFFTNEKGEITHDAEGDHSEIVKWIKINIPEEGKLAPNEVKELDFTIDTPKSASAGGQYASIVITAAGKPFDEEDKPNNNSNASIKEIKKMAHLLYAEVAGNTVKQGTISDVSLPSFLLSGNIKGSALVKNTGNVHGEAIYTLKIFPLFSGEEVYSNEDDPSKFTVLPGRERFSEIAWESTPSFGLFNAEFKVEYEGATETVSKLIIVCPVWLLFLLIFIIIAIIIGIVIKIKRRGERTSRTSSSSQD